MARYFLTEAKLPKKFWFWAIHEANLRLNILPITQQQDGTDNPTLMSTPHFEFFGVKPDYCILFPFGCIGDSVVQEIGTILGPISNHNVCWVSLSVEVNILTVWYFIIPISIGFLLQLTI